MSDSVRECLEIASSWLAWDGRPRIGEGGSLWTPHKALRRITDHLIDHLAEVEALLAGAPTIPDEWHGRTVTFDSDWARFTETDLAETRQRQTRLGQWHELRYAACPAEWDIPRTPSWTLREIADHVSGVTWYARQMGRLT
ncbi:hypothetical protein GCM10009780_14100 [Actinomadura alba]